MNPLTSITTGALLSGALLAAPALATASAPADAHGPTVSVRVEGIHQTLLGDRSLTLPGGTLATAGHRYPAATAAGALQSATHGRWHGTWSSSYGEFLVTQILGETDNFKTTKSYWEFFVNGVPATVGINEAKLLAGDRVVFAAVPASAASPELLSVTAKISGGRLLASVSAVNAKGRTVPVSGARVSEGGHSSLTGARGTVSFTRPTRTVTVTATKSGDVRDAVPVSVG